MTTPQKFDIKTATKAECLAKAEKMLGTAIRQEEAGKNSLMETAFRVALKHEDAAFDGRS